MSEKPANRIVAETKYQVAGWILFIICAIFFIVASIMNHDILTFMGSVIFLIACIVFLLPIVKASKVTGDDQD